MKLEQAIWRILCSTILASLFCGAMIVLPLSNKTGDKPSSENGGLQNPGGMIFRRMLDTVGVCVRPGWNLVSLPITVANRHVSSLFPNAISGAFTYGRAMGYILHDSMEYGRGYWLKFAGGDTLELEGNFRDVDTIYVLQGWNLIGSISFSVPVDSVVQIPPGILEAMSGQPGNPCRWQIWPPLIDTLWPGAGYWVRVAQDGRLVLRKPGS